MRSPSARLRGCRPGATRLAPESRGGAVRQAAFAVPARAVGAPCGRLALDRVGFAALDVPAADNRLRLSAGTQRPQIPSSGSNAAGRIDESVEENRCAGWRFRVWRPARWRLLR